MRLPTRGITLAEHGRSPRETPMPPDELIRLLHATYAAPHDGVTDADASDIAAYLYTLD